MEVAGGGNGAQAYNRLRCLPSRLSARTSRPRYRARALRASPTSEPRAWALCLSATPCADGTCEHRRKRGSHGPAHLSHRRRYRPAHGAGPRAGAFRLRRGGLRGHLGRHRGTRPRCRARLHRARSEAARRRRAFHLPRHPGQKLGAHPHAHLLGKRVRRGHGHEPGGRRLRDQALSARRAARAPAGVAAAQREPCCRYDDPPQRRDVEHGCRHRGIPRTHRRTHAQRAAHPADTHAQPRRGGASQRDHVCPVGIRRLHRRQHANRRGVGYTV